MGKPLTSTLPSAMPNCTVHAMTEAIRMDASGRLVLPSALRDRLNLRGSARLRADIVADHIELTPVGDAAQQPARKKGGVTVLARTGAAVDTATAVAAEREAQADRGLRR